MMRTIRRSQIRLVILAAFAAIVFSVNCGWAAPASESKSVSLKPEALGAKAYLESLIVRRYSLELATLVHRDEFSLGAQLDLTSIAPTLPAQAAPKKPGDEPLMTDLMLGSLDPEGLLKQVLSPSDERRAEEKILEKYRIRNVMVSVGLSEELNPAIKAEVEVWLKKRLTAEFGSAGKGAVAFIKKTPSKKIEDKLPTNIWEWITHYQTLSGQIIMAISILVGIMLWQMMSMFKSGETIAGGGMGIGASEDSSDFASLSAAAAEIQADNEKEQAKQEQLAEKESLKAINDLESIKNQLRQMAPRLTGYFEDVIRTWCNMGDAGRLRLACFAEVAGQETGKLPIPVDALPDVQKVFLRMPEISAAEKRDALEKAYWDLLSTMNLGSDSLNQPFSYLDGISVNMVKRILVDQNPKLKALVSLYMPDELRAGYLQTLTPQAKRELLEQTASLSEVTPEEIETLDRTLMSRVHGTGRTAELLPVEMSLKKIASTLTPSEEVTMLSDMWGDAVEDYKRTVPSLAFLREWPEDKLRMLMMGLTPDELISYLRIRPDMKERLLSVASMMVSEIAGDELTKPDKTPLAEHEKNIQFFTTRLRSLVEQNDINLQEIFGGPVEAPKTEGGEDPNGPKQAA